MINVNDLEISAVSEQDAPYDILTIADPSEELIRKYLQDSQCYIGKVNGKTVGAYILRKNDASTMELLNIAVVPEYQAEGIGSELLKNVIETSKGLGAGKVVLGTGTFGYQLAFYQKAGFRVDSIEKNFFLDNYDEPVIENGIQLKDMLRLSLSIDDYC